MVTPSKMVLLNFRKPLFDLFFSLVREFCSSFAGNGQLEGCTSTVLLQEYLIVVHRIRFSLLIMIPRNNKRISNHDTNDNNSLLNIQVIHCCALWPGTGAILVRR